MGGSRGRLSCRGGRDNGFQRLFQELLHHGKGMPPFQTYSGDPMRRAGTILRLMQKRVGSMAISSVVSTGEYQALKRKFISLMVNSEMRDIGSLSQTFLYRSRLDAVGAYLRA